MKFIADFHIHSKYSRATSKDMDLENLEKWAKIKGLTIIGTGDFTHPEWFQELKEKLEKAEPGLYKLKKNNNSKIRFVLTTEISCVYSKNNKTRKVHLLLFAPSLEIVEKINTHLGWIGNLKADGRPTLGIEAKELLKIVLEISPECAIVPAHCLTPWFGIFGSKSGFDSIEECFEEYSKYIFALESGLSADPSMIWRIPAGQQLTIISNSDSHSPSKIGREANVFDLPFLSYSSIITTIKTRDPQNFLYTIEFFPEEGKYHYDGHRSCGIRLSPQETKKYNGICPVCQRPLTVGVMSRVEELANQPERFKPEGAIPFKKLVPLEEIIAEALETSSNSQQVKKEYENLIKKFENEFNVLIEASPNDLEVSTFPEVVEGILRVREGRVFVEPGYDGVYGKVKIFSKGEQKTSPKQGTLL